MSEGASIVIVSPMRITSGVWDRELAALVDANPAAPEAFAAIWIRERPCLHVAHNADE